MDSASIDSINIRPGVSILSVLKHLNYKPWFALAEFVDNAIQSYLEHSTELQILEGSDFKLIVSIDIDPTDDGKITISDNAAGIYRGDYARAFRPAAVPPETSGLNEFGMGMKSAACWFAEKFTVRTGALGEEVAREVYFDVNKIIQDSLEELTIKTTPKDKDIHFTRVTLSGLHRPLHGKTISKIKEHLASIYRDFFRKGILELTFDGDPLSYSEPEILKASYYKDELGPQIEWRKEINFDLGGGLSASGFAAIRETANISKAGFALFRRSRVIQGSGDEGYRPEFIFKKPNSFLYQRLYGELHLEGFDVSHTKDGFRWEDNEEAFLELLEEHLDAEPIPLLKQAEGHRVNPRPGELRRAAESATKHTAEVIEREMPQVIGSQLDSPIDESTPPIELSKATQASKRIIKLEINNTPWEITLDLSIDPSIDDWVDISNQPSLDQDVWKVGIRMSLVHPFMVQFSGADPEKVEALLRVATAIVLAEVTAAQSGIRGLSTLRRNINQYLKDALSKP
ncbi:MAG: ATP-binding protein [Candidatus Levyibacteriota bacterium]|nr:MAG: ATP-binding protein [Candidatus Levybacteria bacterium]